MPSTPVLLEFTCGACDALDDFTSYLTPDKLEDLYAMIDGNFVGLGVELKIDKEGLRLVGVIRGGPAWEAGLKAGELIVSIDGHPIKGLSLDEAANRLQGTEGTAVEIAAQARRRHRPKPEARPPPRRRRKRRQRQGSESRRGNRLSPAHGLSEILRRARSTAPLTRLPARACGSWCSISGATPADYSTWPSRSPSGSSTPDSVVSTRGRAQGQTQSLATRGPARWRMPMYVLVDHDSASASEILAGALQDHNRATILGSRTYGKGSVQSIFSLRSAPAGLKLTTAKFYSPRNRPYSEQGVQPDIPITVRSAAKPAGSASAIREDSHFGDPERDMVLAAAIRTAKERSQPAR